MKTIRVFSSCGFQLPFVFDVLFALRKILRGSTWGEERSMLGGSPCSSQLWVQVLKCRHFYLRFDFPEGQRSKMSSKFKVSKYRLSSLISTVEASSLSILQPQVAKAAENAGRPSFSATISFPVIWGIAYVGDGSSTEQIAQNVCRHYGKIDEHVLNTLTSTTIWLYQIL